MFRPVILAVDEYEKSLHDVERELSDRYERSYRIVCVDLLVEGSASTAETSAHDR